MVQGRSGALQPRLRTLEFINATREGNLMNFASHGGRLVVFLVVCAITLIVAAVTAWVTSDDVTGTEHNRVTTADHVRWGDGHDASAPDDNDDNPHVGRSHSADADDRPLTGSEKAKIAAAALKAVGSGTVTDMEPSDDLGAAYEAEVYDRTGGEWDVELDATFAVVAKERDS